MNFVNIDFGAPNCVQIYIVNDPFYQNKRLTHFFSKSRNYPFYQNRTVYVRGTYIMFEYWILKIAIFERFWATGNFQNSIFSPLRPKSKFWSLEHDFQVSSIYLKKSRRYIEKKYFRGIAIKVRVCNVISCIFAIWKCNNFG